MKTLTITLTTIILFLSLVSALELNAGECTILDIQVEDEVTWDIIEGVNITQNNSEIKICLSHLFETTNFTLQFYVDEEPLSCPTCSSGSSGGSSKTVYKDKIITEYETDTEYVDKIVNNDVPGETITNNNWVWIMLLLILVVTLFGYILFKKENIDERRLD